MLRAAAAPERFLTRGFARFASRAGDEPSPRGRARGARAAHANDGPCVELPSDLARFLALVAGRRVGDFAPSLAPRASASPSASASARGPSSFASHLAAARRDASRAPARPRARPRDRARLCALLAGAVPFGESRTGELWLCVIGDAASLARGAVLALDPHAPASPRPAYRGVSAFALACALREAHEDDERAEDLRARLPAPNVAEQEAVRTAFERARAVLDLVVGDDVAVRRAAKKLSLRSLDVPPPSSARRTARGAAKNDRHAKGAARARPLVLGALVEAFFRKASDDEARDLLAAHEGSRDAIVASAAALLGEALAPAGPRSRLAKDLARRRELALRAARTKARLAKTRAAGRDEDLTGRMIARIDALRPTGDPLATSDAREEALLALGELGDRACVPSLVARAVIGDVSAVDMLGALRDHRAVPHLAGLLAREPQRYRHLEAAAARALAALGARQTAPALRALLVANPMPTWREGIERGVLVRELVAALGALEDTDAGPALLAVLEATSQEYRAVLPLAAWALGRVRYAPALSTLERLLGSPKAQVGCEAVWALGAIASAHGGPASERAAKLLDGLAGLEPGAEMVRLTALAKVLAGTSEAPRAGELRRALERALWEPAFRNEETARRRTWAFRSLEELAQLALDRTGDRAPPSSRRGAKDARPRGAGEGAYFLGHDAVRYFVTRDDPRVRLAAESAFAAWGTPVPETRRYFTFVLDELEQSGGLAALHDAVRDPLGVYGHNVATRLAERAHASSVRPLAEATARLFAEPPTSTYEYDDAPAHLVAFVRALAKLNRPEGNDVLIEGLRHGNHHVRAVVAENAPDDERFVPELMAMLGDPRSFLRSRAEKSLAALGVARGVTSDPPPRLVEV
jgi:hypothetical protein